LLFNSGSAKYQNLNKVKVITYPRHNEQKWKFVS